MEQVMVLLRFLFFVMPYAFAANVFLIAITDPSCHVCDRWMQEIGEHYEIIRQTHGYPQLKEMPQNNYENRLWVYKNIGLLTYLPTFALMRDGEIVGSFRGYASPQEFYEEMDHLLLKLKG